MLMTLRRNRMKPLRIILLLATLIPFVFGCANATASPSGTGNPPHWGAGTQIIADHTVVSQYDKIPQKYIDLVKQMWVNIPGQSHSQAYRDGLSLLATIDPKFAVNVVDTSGSAPEAYTSAHLRSSKIVRNGASGWENWCGEEYWYTNEPAIAQMKAHLDYCNTNGLQIAAFGFGWCWDMYQSNDPGGTIDPLYNVHWAGASNGGPLGDLRWGLDAGDQALTGNPVCMDTYLNATQSYADYCASKGYATKVFFTTGPVDSYTGENGYQGWLKHEYMRAFVKKDKSRILFDYADILCYNDAGALQTTSWTDGTGAVHNYPVIHDANMNNLSGGYDPNTGHIGEAGALRLGKAQWWMLARIAGWDGVSSD